MYHAQRHANRIVLFILIALCGFAALAVAQIDPNAFVDPAAVQDKLETFGWFSSMPIWAQAVLPFVIPGLAALASAILPDKWMGVLAPLINTLGGNSWGQSKGSQ